METNETPPDGLPPRDALQANALRRMDALGWTGPRTEREVNRWIFALLRHQTDDHCYNRWLVDADYRGRTAADRLPIQRRLAARIVAHFPFLADAAAEWLARAAERAERER